eukprot:2306577-Pleurochrysis_carterae.AAC.1
MITCVSGAHYPDGHSQIQSEHTTSLPPTYVTKSDTANDVKGSSESLHWLRTSASSLSAVRRRQSLSLEHALGSTAL